MRVVTPLPKYSVFLYDFKATPIRFDDLLNYATNKTWCQIKQKAIERVQILSQFTEIASLCLQLLFSTSINISSKLMYIVRERLHYFYWTSSYMMWNSKLKGLLTIFFFILVKKQIFLIFKIKPICKDSRGFQCFCSNMYVINFWNAFARKFFFVLATGFVEFFTNLWEQIMLFFKDPIKFIADM